MRNVQRSVEAPVLIQPALRSEEMENEETCSRENRPQRQPEEQNKAVAFPDLHFKKRIASQRTDERIDR